MNSGLIFFFQAYKKEFLFITPIGVQILRSMQEACFDMCIVSRIVLILVRAGGIVFLQATQNIMHHGL